MAVDHPESRRRNARNLSKWLFLAVALGGAAAIITFELLSYDKVWATATCCIVMLAYVAVAWALPGWRVRADQLADNAYYLGLLYTLVSLAMALFRFSDALDLTMTIIRSFGVALGTTIVGLALRVLISQFRDDPDDIEQEARLALGESVRRMRGELDDALLGMKQFADGVQQILSEVGENARAQTGDALSAAVGRFEASVSAMAERLEESTRGISDKTAAFDASVGRVVDAVEGLASRVGAIRADASMVEEIVRPAYQALNEATQGFASDIFQHRTKFDRTFKAISRVAESSEQLGETTGALSLAAARIQASADALAAFDLKFENLSKSLDGFAERVASAGGKLDESAGEASQRLGQLTTESADRFRQMREDLAASHTSVEQVRRELAELAGWIIKRLEPAQ